ncbi:CHROMOBOX PROTEIN [Encephalitozoon cuniculi GB-M1]|uniref:CHROMOBOX PROTEIN n=2 Tax=Encephalitozoon cuniculi TaxID=6035 RepID=Q8SSD0_ENCCU|nr:chromatin organization modifier domain-containing protein [Encephalitozoon cuniculi GB-M1]AGE96569.1 chromobox protein [Encephalitozoon cuniculi]KMV66381.1 chromatin organization modifierdomain-containing protein [Encephalitozoon cuniculi EcunIII-L]UYI28007.1 chromobox protein-like protein [Encephalitozoon cuniculi]CAD26164.1 CHROMOBOX PROTEIN [Encephalitozoon cuniculi GB-M1]
MKGADIYTVDRIVGDRKKKGVKQYLVKWEGYPDSENTWEDEKNIFSKELIKEYEESRKGSKSSSSQMGKKRASTGKTNRKHLTSKDRAITNEWDGLVDRVVSVEKNRATLVVWLLFKDGKKGRFPVSQVHIRCPLHLLEYYEDNLVFCEDGKGSTK